MSYNYDINLTIEMENEEAAANAILLAADVISKRSSKEKNNEGFSELADLFYTNGKQVLVNGQSPLYRFEYDDLLTRVLKKIAKKGYLFKGVSHWGTEFDSINQDFSICKDKIVVNYIYHLLEDEPMCEDCDEYYERVESNGTIVYRCPECGTEMSEDEFLEFCEYRCTEKYKI